MTVHVVAGTGPRALEQADPATRSRAVQAVQLALTDLIRVHGGRLVVMSGLARGFDHLIARTSLDLGVRLWAAVPNRRYSAHYWRDWPEEFTRIVNAAWRVTHVMEDVHGMTGLYLDGRHANFIRNQWMVDGDPEVFAGADEFLAWGGKSRGTKDCLDRIRKAGKPYRDLAAPDPLPITGGA